MKNTPRARVAALPFALAAAFPCLLSGASSAWAQAADNNAGNTPTLAPVTVTEERGVATPLVKPSTAGSRLELTPFETPASIAIVPGELIRELGTSSVIDAKTLAPGLSSANSPGNGGNLLNARGFTGTNSVKQLYNGLELNNAGGVMSFPFDPWNVERIEALYGPASVLYGAGAIGGAVNVVAKRPDPKKASHEIGFGIGSNKARHEAISSTGPLGGGLSYRVDLSHRSSDNWVERSKSDTLAASASLRFDVSPELNFVLAADHGRQKPMHYLGTPVFNGAPVPGTEKINYNITDSDLFFQDKWLTLDTEWKPSDHITVHNTLYNMEHNRRYRDVTVFTYQPATSAVRRSSYRDISHSKQTQRGVNTWATFQGDLAGMKNQFLAGLQVERSFYDRFDNNRGGATVVDALNPVPGTYTQGWLGESIPMYYLTLNKVGVFAENRLTVNERWSVVAGLRSDNYRTEREDRQAGRTTNGKVSGTSGSLGVVFNPVQELALYGQIATAQDPVTSLASIGANQQGFGLSKGQQVEVGLKQTLWGGRLDWTLAAYHLRKKDLLTANLANPTVQEQVGQQSSRGIEASVTTRLGSWRLEANGTVLDAKFDDFKAQVGGATRQLAGNVPMTVPKRAANIIAFWDFAPQWTARTSLQYVGQRFVNNTNTASLPAYTVANAGVNWRATRGLTLDLRVDNLFDKTYATQGSDVQWILGRPRTVWLSGSYAF
ncbi:TonB-dependent receptor [Hydrogenophaga palleronii]|uniref:TonB-dependent receptor n=1 Tax=Hydrogenophaga palleronii TaxID=65655 RepID=UPI00082719A5|nr:TonB-dependent receptor [Hydrogenophaga palleronii]